MTILYVILGLSAFIAAMSLWSISADVHAFRGIAERQRAEDLEARGPEPSR